MSKSKPQELQSNGIGSKRKKLHSSESEISVDVKLKRRVRKRRTKTGTEEAPIQSLPEPMREDTQRVEKPKKHKQSTEHTQNDKKRRKRKISTSPEPAADPVLRQEENEATGGEEEDLSPEERRVLERKMKKILKKEEKNKRKTERSTEEEAEATKPVAEQQALDYLTCWAEKRKEWKFQKTRQTWLLQHMFDAEKVLDQNFLVLLTYLEGLRGAARDTTVQKAEALVREQGEGSEDVEEAQKKTQRAREVIQLLS